MRIQRDIEGMDHLVVREIHQLRHPERCRHQAVVDVVEAVGSKRRRVAEATLEFVGQNRCQNCLATGAVQRIRDRQHGAEVVRRMARFQREVRVVPIEIPDQRSVGQRGGLDGSRIAVAANHPCRRLPVLAGGVAKRRLDRLITPRSVGTRKRVDDSIRHTFDCVRIDVVVGQRHRVRRQLIGEERCHDSA